jgi:Oligosaccaryltransferase
MITDEDLGNYSVVGGFLVMGLILAYHYTTAPKSKLDRQ